MNRRSFFKRVALGVAALCVPLPTLPRPPVRWEINPAWVNAPYEVGFLVPVRRPIKEVTPVLYPRDRPFEPPPGFTLLHEPWPVTVRVTSGADFVFAFKQLDTNHMANS